MVKFQPATLTDVKRPQRNRLSNGTGAVGGPLPRLSGPGWSRRYSVTSSDGPGERLADWASARSAKAVARMMTAAKRTRIVRRMAQAGRAGFMPSPPTASGTRAPPRTPSPRSTSPIQSGRGSASSMSSSTIATAPQPTCTAPTATAVLGQVCSVGSVGSWRCPGLN